MNRPDSSGKTGRSSGSVKTRACAPWPQRSGLLRGQAKSATALFLEIPGKIGLQASWQYELGICELEAGKPEQAAAAFTEALTLAPDIAVRPVAAYYLEKLGKPVPPPRDATVPDTKK